MLLELINFALDDHDLRSAIPRCSTFAATMQRPDPTRWPPIQLYRPTSVAAAFHFQVRMQSTQ